MNFDLIWRSLSSLIRNNDTHTHTHIYIYNIYIYIYIQNEANFDVLYTIYSKLGHYAYNPQSVICPKLHVQ
jgi:hypothetical protein